MNIPIVMACNDKYAPPLGVAILSILDHRKMIDDYDIRILYTDLSYPNKNRLENLSCEKFSVKCIKILPPKLPKTNEWISKETYYRLFAADLLGEYEKILYLDCDIIVLSDLALLYKQELGNKLVGGVCDYRFDGGYAERIIGISTENYINAGVLLINSSLWRQEKIAKECLNFLGEGRKLEAYDQDAINFACKGRILMLDKEWNFQQVWPEIFNWHPHHLGFRKNACLLDNEIFQFSGCGILHFVCGEKPWDYPARELSEYFWTYARGTIFYEILQAKEFPMKKTNVVTRGLACLQENGLSYTLKRVLVKVRDRRN